MEITSYIFGDVISYKGTEYIFLTSTDDAIYLAKIFTREETSDLIALDKKTDRKNDPKYERGLIFCFVVLKTQEFKNRAASLARPVYPFDRSTNKLSTILDLEDLKALKKEILESNTTSILKEKIRDEVEL